MGLVLPNGLYSTYRTVSGFIEVSVTSSSLNSSGTVAIGVDFSNTFAADYATDAVRPYPQPE